MIQNARMLQPWRDETGTCDPAYNGLPNLLYNAGEEQTLKFCYPSTRFAVF